ncbi:hypothetical protein CLOBOL_02953 [Enterocloster bolteae ATCC BAA-613]|uniref:Uncharacterized protein n=1 Tax=Enterocloster bolteae (strain ATCC BAA-613 / DSM 15670 / CCUG 46953 / JCM 12243 / WAL 16351) TaxID=411902 RepID=A8RR94_ENTBW|nr:hypothetical protein CLOBOL_02953 [Enterocloster bolteae ATCC BAA-613]
MYVQTKHQLYCKACCEKCKGKFEKITFYYNFTTTT